MTEFQKVPEDLSARMFGVPTAGVAETYEGKAEVLAYFERLKAAIDALGLCYFLSQLEDMSLPGFEDYAAMYSAATGEETAVRELMLLGERLVALERVFNYAHAGLGRQDDYPPDRLVLEPVLSGPYAGQRLEPPHWDRMLDRYYAIHGWDIETGLPSAERLQSLGLGEEVEHFQVT